MTAGLTSNSARDIARSLLANSDGADTTASAAEVTPAVKAPPAVGKPRRDTGRQFGDQTGVVAARERAARALTMGELTGMPNPLFIPRQGPNTSVIEGPYGATTNFSNYNYLGMAHHPKVIKAVQDAVGQYGASASASRITSGEIEIYPRLERRLAEIYDVESAIIATSGYLTNSGVIGFLLGERDAVVADALIHSSVVTGARWAGARSMTFRHNDPESLRGVLRMSRERFDRVLVVIEGHYSMDGDVGRLPEIAAVAREFDCAVMVDEAHSIGVFGAHGHGVREHFGLPGDAVDIWMGCLSKALGSCGGVIAGSAEIVQAPHTSPVATPTVGPPPSAAAAALAALEVLESEPQRVSQLWHNAKLFTAALRERNLNLGFSEGTPIVPVLVPGEIQVLYASSLLLQRGVYVGPVAAPGVGPGQERLRFFVTSEHSQEQLVTTADLVAEVVALATDVGAALTM
ncbi:8-amino-7-oxononanoate synthase [Mycobacterium simulans]|uniref:aminotransferase class I/II-fold pyridoxal phosphate-dependent enzyme n=1 Tax=Mycobacterium simulans TaxID=627089 RepID=UPI00174D474D|nr:aminotransferase class I/II-fold pyridoxal phosphate-dependent enzyme [Mycobacterium simulans]SON62773.1 8-amino-7-oxononanoate synthase [Mycobacterium simulans]